MPTPVETRRLTPADAGILSRVADGVFDEPIHPARVAAYLAEPGHFMTGGVVVAQCAAVVHRHADKPAELYIDEVGVAPAFQRRGVARRLMDEMLELGRRVGCEESWVGTEADNVAARGLYEARGGTPEPFVMYVYQL